MFGGDLIGARVQPLCSADGLAHFQMDRVKGKLESSLPSKKLERFCKVSLYYPVSN